MIFKNSSTLFKNITILLIVNLILIIYFGEISYYFIFFGLLLILPYLIFIPFKIVLEDEILKVYFLLPKRVKKIEKDKIEYFASYTQGLKSGGGYTIKVHFLDKSFKKKSISILESISEGKKTEILIFLKKNGFKVKTYI